MHHNKSSRKLNALFLTRIGSLHGKKAAERPSAHEGAQLGDGATIKLRLEGATVAFFSDAYPHGE